MAFKKNIQVVNSRWDTGNTSMQDHFCDTVQILFLYCHKLYTNCLITFCFASAIIVGVQKKKHETPSVVTQRASFCKKIQSVGPVQQIQRLQIKLSRNILRRKQIRRFENTKTFYWGNSPLIIFSFFARSVTNLKKVLLYS